MPAIGSGQRHQGFVRSLARPARLGRFEITKAALTKRGDRYALSGAWTESLFAHRYMMGIRRREYNSCLGCRNAWTVDLDSTKYDGMVPAHVPSDDLEVTEHGDRPVLDVAAMDKNLYTFVTTGHASSLFSVHPVHSVEGGYGFVGSAKFAYLVLDRRTSTGGDG